MDITQLFSQLYTPLTQRLWQIHQLHVSRVHPFNKVIGEGLNTYGTIQKKKHTTTSAHILKAFFSTCTSTDPPFISCHFFLFSHAFVFFSISPCCFSLFFRLTFLFYMNMLPSLPPLLHHSLLPLFLHETVLSWILLPGPPSPVIPADFSLPGVSFSL